MPDGTAIIADPRNDENMIIAGLQCGVPAVPQPRVDRVRAGGRTTSVELFTRRRAG